MKKVLVVLMLVLLTACTPPKYDRKSDENENYYDDYLVSIGLVDYEEVDNMVSVHYMNDAYLIAGVNQTSSSFFIYHYIGENQQGERFHVLMPDRVGEENLVFNDHLPSFIELELYITDYNDSSESRVIDWAGNNVNTNDIILDEESLRLDFVWQLYTDRTINDVKVEADTETIKDMIFNNLSSPFIYKIGKYFDEGNHAKHVYLGKGINHDLVFILFDSYEIEVEIIYTYDYE
jgi:hypothetical protein